MLNKQKVTEFRGDFEKAVAQLEKDYSVAISLGTISFNSNELRAKMTAKVGSPVVRAIKNDFQVGDIKVQKINVGDSRVGALMNVSPGLLVKK